MQPLLDAMARLAGADPGRPAIADGFVALTRSDLLAAVGAAMAMLHRDEKTVALLAPNGAAWSIAQLACAFAGRIFVPLPAHFSDAQLHHVLADAHAEVILATQASATRAAGFGLPVRRIDPDRRGPAPALAAPGFRQVVYTSGSTGRPKGVVHGPRQIGWSIRSLAEATKATPADLYLGVLPLPLLLETLCAIFIPAFVGASVIFDNALTEAALAGAGGLAAAYERYRPTMTVLVPGLLAAWVAELDAEGRKAPDSLRFAALGGAPIAPDLAEKAWSLEIPVHEGYGLTECCSVVSLNRPGARAAGTVGRPLPGLDLRVEDGEIVVAGPSVMDGYLNGAPEPAVWRTGDLGALQADGSLVVHGRKDALIVTPLGRNISPEWIEALILADPRIAFCGVGLDDRRRLVAALVPSGAGAAWFASADPPAVSALVKRLCASAPDYAQPSRCLALDSADVRAAGLVSSGGRINRPALRRLLADLDPIRAVPA